MLLDKERFSWLFSKLMPWWTYASFTQNIAMGLSGDFGGHFLGITWSLAIEEQFYLFAPLLILVVGKKTWVQALIPLVLLAFIFRLASPGFHSYVNVVFRMDSLLLGVFVAVLYRNEEIWRFLLANRSVLFAAFLCLLLITGGLCLRGFGYFKIFWFALLYGTFLVVSLLYQSSRLTWILRTKFLCFWGSIAYGLYLYHQAVSGLLHGWLRYGEAPSLINGYAASVTGLAFILSTTLAWVSFVYFEAFFLKLGKRQRYGANKSAYATPTGSP
jgi:peptidoglycan/LPS O-acetylase OafA/YrhL